MDFAKVFGGDNVSAYINDSNQRRLFVLSSGDERLVLPITPWKYQVQTAQDNKIVDILDSGEALIFGNSKLKRLKFSCFFPAVKHKYPFAVSEIETADALALIEKWRTNKATVRIIITDSTINLQMAIMDFHYSEKDGTRDIDYTLDLTEFRELNVPRSNNSKIIDTVSGLRNRPAEQTAQAINFLIGNSASDVFDAAKFANTTIQNFMQKNNIGSLIKFNPTSFKSAGWKIF